MKKKLLLSFFISIFFVAFILFISGTLFLYNITNNSPALNQSNLSKEKDYNSSNINTNASIKKNESSINCMNNRGNVIITLPEFINNMQCKDYILKPGDTLISIANNYISTCPLNCSLKLIKEASNISNVDSLNAGTKIRIPENTLNNGYIHTVVYGDTWEKICRDYYPIYNSEYLIQILIFINDLPNNTLPLGNEIYLPNINI